MGVSLVVQMVKNPPECRRPGLIPGLGRSPGGDQGNPLQYSCLENPHGQRSLADYYPSCHKELDMTERLSITQHRNIWGTSPVALVVKIPPANVGDIRDAGLIPGSRRSPNRGQGNPFQNFCLENPMDRGAERATVQRAAKSQT